MRISDWSSDVCSSDLRPGAQADPDALSAHLKALLPDYMVPQHFVALDTIPLSPNGKVDRKALPAPDLGARAAGDLVLPRNETERTIAEAMSQVLGVPDIGVHDDFFALGGHSLLAAQLTTRLNRDLGASLSLRSVFDCPTVARLAETVGQEGDGATPRPKIVRREDQSRAPLSLRSEEHTSELQSLMRTSYAVFCLTTKTITNTNT